MFREKTYIEELIDYIKINLKKGYTKESLKWALIEQGNSKREIERAFKKLDQDLAERAPILKTKPEITRELFDHADQPINIEPERQSFFGRILGRWF